MFTEKLLYPAAFSPLSEEEQLAVSGGGELWDSINDFFENIQFEDFSWGDAFIAVSFTFAPILLFNVIKIVIDMAAANSSTTATK